ncbi:MAG: hypothetical protein WA982_09035 [Rubrobacteraceae bacterium]
MAVLLTSTTLLFGCAVANDAESAPSKEGTGSSVDTTAPKTDETKKAEDRIEVPAYDPQSMQPDDWQKLRTAKVRQAVNIALADQRLQDFLRQNDFEVTEVMKAKNLGGVRTTGKQSHLTARVTVELYDPVPLEQSGYEGAVCAIGGETGPVTGMVWLVDLVDQRVSAVSPQWNYEVSCT